MIPTINNEYIQPNWPAPANIKAYTTLRTNNRSHFLATRKGQPIPEFKNNRLRLQQELNLPEDPIWLDQTHSTIALEAKPENRDKEADASYTTEQNRICVSQTADCLPILLCHRLGTHVAAIHAGWRGLAAGIIESALKGLNTDNQALLAWLGPAISQPNYEVGDEVREAFITHDKETQQAFIPSPQGRWLADLYQIARIRLAKQGVTAIYGGEYCTYADTRFYSFRREKAINGSMASLIWRVK